MKLCMIGTGYVGLVSGVCFADLGNEVICVDNDRDKIDKLIITYEGNLISEHTLLPLENLKKKNKRVDVELQKLSETEFLSKIAFHG